MTEAEAEERAAPEPAANGLVLTGIDGLDELLGGGVPRGHTVTVLGSFGTGKTTFGIQFLVQGLINQEKGIFISLEEDPDSIVASAAGFGWDLATPLKEKRLAIVKLEPADARTTVMKVRSELPKFIKDFGADRVVVDSVSLLNMMFPDDVERRARLFSLSQQIKTTGATALFTAETKDDNPRASRDGLVEYISDGVISLQSREKESGDVQLAMQVMKMRRLKHSRAVKPYTIDDDGLNVHADVEVF
ncbi:MAG TPA: KaiC domain-containing protein [Thermoplasmata archaeon]|nr:KaiC domain-containing protein [Thermoplasmata archaeon]